MVRQDFANEVAEIAGAMGAKFLHRVRAEHAVTLELRFTEKLILRALVWKSFARLEIFVDVARLVSVTGRFDVNEHAIGNVVAVNH